MEGNLFAICSTANLEIRLTILDSCVRNILRLCRFILKEYLVMMQAKRVFKHPAKNVYHEGYEFVLQVEMERDIFVLI